MKTMLRALSKSVFTVVLILSALLGGGAAYAFEHAKVLVINSYHPQYLWTRQEDEGIRDALSSEVPRENIFIEYLDARRHIDDPVLLEKIHGLLRHKYQDLMPSVIITTDDAALAYMLSKGKELFPGIPVVFSGVNIPTAHDYTAVPQLTGVEEGMAIKGNLQLIMRVLPHTKRIVLISDTSEIGSLMALRARSVISEWKKNANLPVVKMDIWQDYSFQELRNNLAKMPADTAVLILAIHRDNRGHYFSYEKELDELTGLASVPLWGMWGSLMLGHGVIGGMMNDGLEHGHIAGSMALKILQGVSAKNIPIRKQSGFHPSFDYKQLERFHIDEWSLPPESRFYGKPETFWETHPGLVYASIGAILSLLMVIIVLSVNMRRRAISEARLDAMNRNLETIVEQRTRELNESNTMLQTLSNNMRNLAHTDHLTKLGNRRSGSEKLAALMKLAKKTGQPFVVAMVDIDHFKNINDTYGHEVGDVALKAVTKALNDGLRPSDMAFRWGGEEFLLILTNTGLDDALRACERLREAVAQLKTEQGYVLRVSIGVAQYSTGEAMRIFLHRADDALYRAKTQGRNCVVAAQD